MTTPASAMSHCGCAERHKPHDECVGTPLPPLSESCYGAAVINDPAEESY